jgi:hypothetical protein
MIERHYGLLISLFSLTLMLMIIDITPLSCRHYAIFAYY